MSIADAQSLHRRTRDALGRLGVQPRRRLGQNFLVASPVVERIVAVARAAGRVVVEIGPGIGALSDALAAIADELFLIEIDTRMAERLADRFAATPNVHVVAADALAVDYSKLLANRRRAVAVGNLPYSVGSQILLRLIEFRASFERLVLMLQREVAERLIAKPGTKAYGVLTVWTALHGEAEIVLRVSRGSFVPRPRVESAVVSVTLHAEPRVSIDDEERFRAVVRAAFGKRRKTLRAALAGIARAVDIERAGIDPGRRGETLSLAEFANLANVLGDPSR
ncbi:MAG TPA: 16S rRNA (adenine(1518)-N(6)/adenine(1519)-N(6))-dimethyltransferase RsmA [Candidatus Binatia bacterium]|nr:16S rRNA (adenine(1518)-N(6)/adenine(1519)-N(6))-dimethyltransferase RsmA [Candidatus Binatia bacterium]